MGKIIKNGNEYGGGGGVTPVISAGASVDSTSGTPEVTVTKTGTDVAPTFNFAFTGLKGPQGADGDDGVGIASVTYKETDASGNYVYTVTLTNNSTYDIVCPRGPEGPSGGGGIKEFVYMQESSIRSPVSHFFSNDVGMAVIENHDLHIHGSIQVSGNVVYIDAVWKHSEHKIYSLDGTTGTAAPPNSVAVATKGVTSYTGTSPVNVVAKNYGDFTIGVLEDTWDSQTSYLPYVRYSGGNYMNVAFLIEQID